MHGRVVAAVKKVAPSNKSDPILNGQEAYSKEGKTTVDGVTLG